MDISEPSVYNQSTRGRPDQTKPKVKTYTSAKLFIYKKKLRNKLHVTLLAQILQKPHRFYYVTIKTNPEPGDGSEKDCKFQ